MNCYLPARDVILRLYRKGLSDALENVNRIYRVVWKRNPLSVKAMSQSALFCFISVQCYKKCFLYSFPSLTELSKTR